MFEKATSKLGLDIGYETLKLVELMKSKTGFELVGSIEIPITEKILEKDRFKNKAATANLIKDACKKAKPNSIKATQIVSALPESFVFSKTIQMPKMNESEYGKAIAAEASQYLPIPITEVYIDYQILITHPDAPLVDILFVAAPKVLVNDYVEMTKMAGFELIALETKPMAVERAVLAAASPRGAAVIIEIGTEISRVIIWDGNIRLITTVNIGNNQLKDALGTSNFNNSNLASHDSLAPAINSFCNEIVNAIKYHQTRDHKPRPVTEIVLCGSGAEVPGMSEKIESALKIKTIRVLPRVEGNEKLKTSFITAVGLAMRPDDK